jgi:hypothetical protein
MFVVEMFTRGTNDPVLIPDNLLLVPAWYSALAVGGFDAADIQVSGTRESIMAALKWLANKVVIRNGHGTRVWVGSVEEIVVTYGAMQVGLSLREMANRIRVAYTTPDAGGAIDRRTTAWGENTESISRYGTREKMVTLSETTDEMADAHRDTQIATLGKPQPVIRMSRSATPPTATLSCIGEWHDLRHQHYTQLLGLEDHNTSGGSTQPLGQGLTSAYIGFTEDGRIHHFFNNLDPFVSGLSVVVSGSTSNDSTVVTSGTGVDGATYTATTISFDPSDDVLDVAGDGLAFLNDNDIITIAGSVDNSSTRRVTNAINEEHITVDGATIIAEAAGPSITITQAGSIRTEGTFTNEFPGATVTLTVHGVKVAQKFALPSAGSWTVNKIAIRATIAGAPSDNLQVALHSDSGGSPGTELEVIAMDGGEITTAMNWNEFTFANTTEITYGSDYWIVVSRSGSNAHSDFYQIDMDEDVGYARGGLKVWTGSAWTTRDPDAHMPFRILGAWETTVQIEQIVTDAAQWIAGYDGLDSSNVFSNQYRAGDGTALDEIMTLLNAGDDSHRRLLAQITPEGMFRLYAQTPANRDTDYMLDETGAVLSTTGNKLEEGVLPAARWIRLVGMPQGVDHLAPLATFFVERAEYRVDTGEIMLEPTGLRNAWDTGMQLE